MLLRGDFHADAFLFDHFPEDVSAGAGCEGFFDICFGDDGNPANSHVEGMKAVFRIDLF